MQAEEQSAAKAPSQPSRAAAKRARKKAAKQGCGTQAEPAAAEQAAASSGPDVITGAADASPQQSPAALSSGDAAPEWCCCALTGSVMRHPVLCGSEGHSFEREALQQRLAANPGVHPISRQPLPPGRDPMLPNHALRNMIQQLGLG
jgi:U-box domain